MKSPGYAVLRDLCRALAARPAPEAGPPAIVLLMADLAGNCHAAQAVRAMAPHSRLLAVLSHRVDHEQTALVLAGVDWFVHEDDPPGRLAALLRALRQRGGCPDAVDGSCRVAGAWRLPDDGWCLAHDGGGMVRLTVSERALLMCLFEAPGRVATTAMLQVALRHAWQVPPCQCPAREPAPRGVVARLRQKARQAGLDLPIESLRAYGYVWRA